MKHLDKKNQRLLLELYRDGRASATELASRIGMSKEATHYRLKKLYEEKILLKVIPVINFSAIGYSTYRIQILLNKEGKSDKENVEKELIKIKNLSWLIKLAGQWDYALLFNVKEREKFYEMYEDFLQRFGKYVDKKIVSIVNSITHLSPSYLLKGDKIKLVQHSKTENYSLDENQKKIINILEEDARIPLLEIARRLNLSVTTIKYHLNILEKNKIILAYKPIINIDLLGYEQFKVMIELHDPSEKNILREIIATNPNTVYITDSLGKYDVEYECQYEHMHELLEEISKIEAQIKIKKYDLIFTNQEIIINGMPDD